MPAGTHHGGLTQRARHGEPQPAPLHTALGDEPVASKRDLKSWWRNFSRGNQKRDDEKGATAQPGIFGVPLQTSVRYANVAISLQDSEGKSYVYGYVPIVVAKCGVFLKEKATDVEGIFRLSGSEKRIKELREAFNSPDRYGKGLDWTGYTVHDAANILRRYFNQLPEPIIPLEFYERFRDPLRNHQSQAVGQMEGQSPSVGDFDPSETIRVYQSLITELPPLNRQLLLYILDLLAVFASKSDLNKMTTPNLAAIFQPGILSHPSHDMAPPEYRLSQDVLIFLIENQDHFLIGMQGTAADEKTKEEVESGPPTPAVARPSKTIVGRSSSNASKYSGVRRSVSVSSRHSRASIAQSPITPVFHSPLGTPTNSGVHRSNTVPSKHSPRTSHNRFQKEQPSDSPSPGATPMYTPAEMPGAYPGAYPGFGEPTTPVPNGSAPPQIIASPADEDITQTITQPTHTASLPIHMSNLPANDSKAQLVSSTETGKSKPEGIAIPHRQPGTFPQTQETPSSAGTSKTFTAIFGPKSPPVDAREGERKPKKLQKKRGPGSANPSAHSSQHSLADIPVAEQASISASTASNAPLLAAAQSTPAHILSQTFLHPASSTDSTPLKPPPNIGLLADPPMSPAHSYRSHSEFTEGEIEDVPPLDHNPAATSGLQGDSGDFERMEKEKKRRFWERKKDSVSHSAGNPLIPNVEAQKSRSSVLSGGEREKERERERERKSLTLDRNAALSDPESSAEGREGGRGFLGRIKGKLAERAEKKEERDRLREEAREEKRRAKSPPPMLLMPGESGGAGTSMQSLTAATTEGSQYTPQPSPNPLIGRNGRSMDIRRDGRSLDVSREHYVPPTKASKKMSLDGGSRDRVDRDRQRSLLDIGEDAVAAKAQRNAAAAAASYTTTSPANAATIPGPETQAAPPTTDINIPAPENQPAYTVTDAMTTERSFSP